MPATKAPSLHADDLPDVMTVAELAAWERIDPRTLRSDLDAGKVPGAYRRGRSWRIVKASYFAGLGGRP